MTPDEPTTPMMEAAHTMREMFVSLLRADFTEDQALRLIGNMFRPTATEDDPQ